MSKILKKIAFIAVLAGLLAWGVAGIAKAPTPVTYADNLNVLQQDVEIITPQVDIVDELNHMSRDQVVAVD